MVAPTITIAGATITDRMISSARYIAIDDIRIEWGRDTLFDTPVPGIATLRIITRGIDTPPPRKGSDIRINYPGYGDVFRGTIAHTDTTEDYVHHANGLREKITETTITAHDPLASFAQFIPAGPATGDERAGQYTGAGGWPDADVTTRVDAIMNAGAGRFVDTYARPSWVVQASPQVMAAAGPRHASDDSALDLLHAAYSLLGPLHTFTYAARDHRLYTAPHQPATHTVVTLTHGPGGVLSITTPKDVYTLPGRLVEIDTGEAEAPADDIATARLEYIRYGIIDHESQPFRYGWTDSAKNKDIPATAGARTFIAPEHARYDATRPPEGADNRYPDWWLARAATVFAAINGTLRLPALIINPEDPRFASAGQTFHTYQRGRSFYLNASKFNGVPGAPAVVQIIGGILTYTHHKGWRHALTPAPTAGGAPTGLPLSRLFPASSSDRLDKWAEDLTINDLAAANRRT